MKTTDDILAACRLVKEAGTSSRIPVPIATLEQLCRDADAWRKTPDYIRDVVKSVEASK